MLIRDDNRLAAVRVRNLIVLLGLFWATTGCKQPRTPSAESNTIVLGNAQKRSFAGDADSFLAWASPSSRYAILYMFRTDTNGDGKVTSRLGDHGEVLGDEPSPILFDIDTGQETNLQAAIIASPDGAFYVYKRQGSLRLFDSNSGQETDLKAAPEPDRANPCLPPREARFDITGSNLGYFRGDRFVVRNLGSQQERSVPANGIWRAEPTPVFEWIHQAESEDPPRVMGSCPCRWCAQFAHSIGRYKFEGSATTALVRTDGLRNEQVGVVPISRDWLVDPQAKTLISTEEKTLACPVLAVFPGSGKSLIRCGEQRQLLDLSTDTRLDVPNITTQEWMTFSIETSTGPAAAVWLHEKGERRLAGLNLQSGEVLAGPKAQRISVPSPTGWITVGLKDEVNLFNIGSGAMLRYPGTSTELGALSFANAKDWHVVDPVSKRTLQVGWHVTDPASKRLAGIDKRPQMVGTTGCYIRPSGPSHKISRGPWTRVCPC